MLKTSASTWIRLLCILAFAFAGAAHAGVLATSARVNNVFTYIFAPGGTPNSLVALDDAGNTTKSFTLASTQTVIITISAECSGNTAGTTVTGIVVLDGVTIATGDGGAPFRMTRWCVGGLAPEMVTRTVYASLAAGNHTVELQAAVEGAPFVFYSGTFAKIVLAVTN